MAPESPPLLSSPACAWGLLGHRVGGGLTGASPADVRAVIQRLKLFCEAGNRVPQLPWGMLSLEFSLFAPIQVPEKYKVLQC